MQNKNNQLISQTRKPLPPSLIHLISQYTTGNFNFTVFSKLNQKTRRDLLKCAENNNQLTIDLNTSLQLPLLLDQSYTYIEKFAKHIKIKLNSAYFDIENPNYNSDEYIYRRELFRQNQERLCAFFTLYVEQEVQKHNYSLDIVGYTSKFNRTIKQLLKFNRMDEIQISFLNFEYIEMFELINCSKSVIIRNQIPINIINYWYENQCLDQISQIQSIQISKFIDSQQVAILDLIVNANNLVSLELTDQCMIYLDNTHLEIFKRLRTLIVIDSTLPQRAQNSCNIFEHMNALNYLCLPFFSKPDLDTIALATIPLLSQLQRLQLKQPTNLIITLPLQSILAWVKVIYQSNESLKDVKLEVHQVEILLIDEPIQLDKSPIEYCKQLEEKYGVSIQYKRKDQEWIEIIIAIDSVKWNVFTKRLSINYCI